MLGRAFRTTPSNAFIKAFSEVNVVHERKERFLKVKRKGIMEDYELSKMGRGIKLTSLHLIYAH